MSIEDFDTDPHASTIPAPPPEEEAPETIPDDLFDDPWTWAEQE
jgi:hypothetical protein